MGAASRWWLHESLNALNRSLGGRLRCHVGNARDVLPQLAADVGAEGITWNRCYEPWRIARDRDIEEKLTSQGVHVEHFNGSLLFEPPTVLKPDGTPYKVFTPFFRKGCLGNAPAPEQPVDAPTLGWLDSSRSAQGIDRLGLMPGIPWYEEMAECWRPDEDGAHARLQQFLESGIQRYKEGRKFDPAGDYVRKYIPELARLPTKVLHSPWEAPTDVLDAAGVKLGTNYPQPIVDLKATRARALEAFSSLSAS